MKKLIYLGFVILCLILINNLLHSIYDLWHKQDLVVSAQKNLQEQKEENRKLKMKLSQVNSDSFVEEEARNKLFLVKPGESDVILPQTRSQSESKKPQLPNWQKWLNLFL